MERLGDDDSILLILPLESVAEAESLVIEALAGLGNTAVLAKLVHSGLEATGAFGAAFRENAGRALLLPKGGFGKRTPLWVTRLKAKRLFAKIRDVDDFPITVESWRSVLEGRFDLPGVTALCGNLASGDTELVRYRTTAPSPFASRLGWSQTNHFLYEGDELGASNHGTSHRVDAQSGIKRGLGANQGRTALDEAVERALGSASLRPSIPLVVARDIGVKLRRELPGWAPESPDALADWVDERVFIPLDEWNVLMDACSTDLAYSAGAVLSASDAGSPGGLLSRLITLSLPGSAVPLVLRREREQELLARPEALIGEWLRSSGPVAISRLDELFGLGSGIVLEILAELEYAGAVICDQASFNIVGLPAEAWVCDRDALEAMLRATRRSARAVVRPRPASEFPSFVAFIHGLGSSGSSEGSLGANTGTHGTVSSRLNRVLESLSGFPARAGLWETELLPCRIPTYRREYLDRAIGSGDWLWFGAGRGTISFARAEDISLFINPPASALSPPGALPGDVWSLKDSSGLGLDVVQTAVWKEVWRGALTTDSFEAVRKGLLADFKADSPSSPSDRGAMASPGSRDHAGRRNLHPRVPLAIRDRWKLGSPLPGRWFGLAVESIELDEADELDLATDRVRAVARRYGLVARFLLEKELPLLSWSALFSAIRRLELAGELLSGLFF